MKTLTFNLHFLSDPLEQFDVLKAFIGSGQFTITNLSLIFFINICLIYLLCRVFLQKEYTNYHFIFESSYNLVKNILRENLSIKKQQYFTIVFYLFLVIVLSNLIGMIPYSFTVTSSFIVTFFLAAMHFIGINLIGATQLK
jgi:F-type H+-transporting ATPase subunit a